MLSQAWKVALQSLDRRKVLLASVVFGRDIYQLEKGDFMTLPGAIRGATHEGVVVKQGRKSFPFWPTVIEWSNAAWGMSPMDRRVEVATVSVRFSRDAGLPIDELGLAGSPTGIGELSLWTDGIELKDRIVLIKGPITEAKYNRTDGIASLTIADGDIRRSVEFPPGEFRISRDEFPDAPDYVAGYAPRSTIFGPFPDQIPCYQIDSKGKEFYVCEPALTIGPSKVYVGGTEVRNAGVRIPRLEIGNLSNYQTYSKLVFDQPISDSTLTGQVTCSGGEGITSTHPAVALLEYGQYDVDTAAAALLKRLPLNFFVYVNNKGNVLELVRDRILPQTDLIGGFRKDKFSVYQLYGTAPEITLSTSSGLIYRKESDDVETGQDSIFNVFEIRFKRDLFSTTESSKDTYLIDKDHGPAPLRALCAASEKRYGRRYTLIEAPDLVQYLSGGTQNFVPLSVVQLGQMVVYLHTKVHKQWTYLARWHDGMVADINWKATITDPDSGLYSVKTRIVRKEISPLGPYLTFWTE